ncbi:hypothetical protein KUV50_09830 [Membranicola marinus]|uniref:Tetratricopeptide repeat-containing protein n=1 Tax=Membranihabitans marinus TaxID=1227546 RepID=A0A953HUG8_9BACT|nr:hypothetical protein [Membranihabitans marinus]MBY5958431.1 hypothetical protein [Membranihabitans marinus]
MENTKIYRIIAGMTSRVRQEVIPYLENYTGGRHTLTFRLYEVVSAHLEKGTGNLDRKDVWKKLYKSKDIKDVTLRKMCADLMNHMELALSALRLKESPMDRRLYYLNFLMDHEFDHDLVTKEISKSVRLFQSENNDQGPGYYERFRLEELDYGNNFRSGSAWKKSNIDRIDENLNAFFVLEKLRLALSIYSRQKYIQYEKELPFLEVIFQLIDSGNLDDYPLIRLYYYAVLTYQNEDGDQMYFNLKAGLNALPLQKGNDYVRELITIALSYCIGKINQNQSSFYREALDWYQMMIRASILVENEHLAATTYRNIVLIAIRLQEYDWAINFAEDYSVYLKSDIRESTMMLSLGQIAFNKEDYDQVIRYLMNVDYISLSYNLQSKLILAATYYELGEYDLLSNFLSTFSTYLRRKKSGLSSEKYDRHQRFINLLNQITKTPDWEHEKWQDLLHQLQSDHEVVSYSWLVEKIEAKQ